MRSDELAQRWLAPDLGRLWEVATVLRVRRDGSDAATLRVELPEPAHFAAGQYYLVRMRVDAAPGAFANRKDEFTSRNTRIIGVSVDSVESHKNWSVDIAETQGRGLNYPLVVDEDRTVANLYGMIHPKALETATVRTVFIIGPDKKVKLTLTYPASVGRNIDEILRVLDALQLTTGYSVSTPVDWKQGGEVITSPVISDEDAKTKFPKGFRTLKPYLRLTPQPDA